MQTILSLCLMDRKFGRLKNILLLKSGFEPPESFTSEKYFIISADRTRPVMIQS